MSDQYDSEAKVSEKTNFSPLLIGVLILIVIGGIAWYMMQLKGEEVEVNFAEPTVVTNEAQEAVYLETELSREIPIPSSASGAELADPANALIAQSVVYTSSESAADLVTFYVSAITERGGQIESSMSLPTREIIEAKLSDGRFYVVYIDTLEDGTARVQIEVEQDLQAL